MNKFQAWAFERHIPQLTKLLIGPIEDDLGHRAGMARNVIVMCDRMLDGYKVKFSIKQVDNGLHEGVFWMPSSGQVGGGEVEKIHYAMDRAVVLINSDDRWHYIHKIFDHVIETFHQWQYTRNGLEKFRTDMRHVRKLIYKHGAGWRDLSRTVPRGELLTQTPHSQAVVDKLTIIHDLILTTKER